MNKNNHAFTLIELLIVISIIIVIVGLVLPVLSMVRGKAKQAVCMSNMGQMFKCFAQYAIENDGYLPLESNSGTCSGEVWFKAIDRYITTDILSENQNDISIKEKLSLIKQDPVFKNSSSR
jgi:type II secretory pathway pseudopilin PulG